MKKALVLTALSAALLVSFPASAADPVQPAADAAAPSPKAVKKQSDMLDALTALGTELKVVIGSAKGNPIPYMDKLAAHEYSAPTKEKLAKVFGTTEPLTIKRSAADGGAVAYAVTAPAFNYLDQDATAFSWSELGVNLLIDKAGQNMTSNGSWSNFSVVEKSMTLTVSDMSLESKQRRSTQNIWLGTAHVGIGKIAVAPVSGPGVVMEGLTFASNVSQHAKAIDIGYESQIKSVKMLGESVDDIRFAMRMLNIDMRALEKMTEAMAAAEKAGINKEQRLAMVMDQFKLMGKSAALRGTSLDIDDFSLGFHGNRAVIKGKVSLLKGTDADFASAAKFANKVVARLQVRVPLVMVSDIAKTVMTREAEGKGEKPSAEGIAQAAQSVTDVIVGKVITGGYAKLEAGMLVSLIEFKGGKLTFNGKEVSLPKGPTPPAKPVETAKPAEAAK